MKQTKSITKIRSLKKTIQMSYIFLIGIMIIPTIYSVVVLQIHTKQYDDIITNVSNANRINQIAKTDVPNWLWEIVCGKKDFYNDSPYPMIEEIFDGISEMQHHTKSLDNKQKLEVAYRACTTLDNNIKMLENQMYLGSTVTANETSLDEIRTITSLFSDIMQDFILSEIETANETNISIKHSSIILTILQIIIITFSLLVCINGYISVSKSINRPLSDMKELSTQIASGNLDARTKVPDVDELIPLANNMNLMAEQINVLIEKNIEEQKNIQKAEMKALQAQITPHFLYNTFDTIIWLAEEEKTEEVVKITKAFSEFLRISLSRGHEWITISQELDHIKNYLTIQKIRYADILNYDIEVDEEILDYKIIKLVLQPLVENAIYHGIKNKRGRGHLKVTANFTDDTKSSIMFVVTDDGAGFTTERLAEVKNELENASLDAEQLSSVYGLYNVHKKLKLYYGKKTEGLVIESEHKKGSKISFVIPCVAGEQNV
ncbi:MAG: histidine kinase [Treponema sp.]|nr:histidine kinase [Treponema sp.]